MSSNFNIIVGTSPSSEISLEKELQLIKVGLIYAYKVELFIKSKKLEIEMYGNEDNCDVDLLLKQFLDSMGEAVTRGKAYPLFDEFTGNLVKSGISEGLFKLNDISSEKSRHIGFVSNIMQRLPCFEYATIDEILDIRKELSKPLIRFRSVMIKYA